MREDFDLVTLDITMPGMGGLECLDRIRERSDAPQIFEAVDAGREI